MISSKPIIKIINLVGLCAEMLINTLQKLGFQNWKNSATKKCHSRFQGETLNVEKRLRS